MLVKTTRSSNCGNEILELINHMKKHTIQLTAIMVLGSLCFLASCATQPPTAKTSSLTGTFAQANPSPTFSRPYVFFTHKGKLYVHSTPATKTEFASDPDANMSTADNNGLIVGPATYNTESHGFEEPWPFGPESSQQ